MNIRRSGNTANLIAMKSEMYEKRVAVLALHKVGKSANQIYSLLKKLPITKRFVFRTIARYKETGSVENRPRKGRPRSLRTEKVIKAVRSLIIRNALRQQKVMAREMHIPSRTLSRIIKEDLGMKVDCVEDYDPYTTDDDDKDKNYETDTTDCSSTDQKCDVNDVQNQYDNGKEESEENDTTEEIEEDNVTEETENKENNRNKNRSDGSRQSIEEFLVKFKERSTMKQYLLIKPVEWGIKIWIRSDASASYSGKDVEHHDRTLRERAIYKLIKLISTIKDKSVVLCFDRLFTSVRLMNEIPDVGTIIKNRENRPKRLNKGKSECVVNSAGTICIKWQDTMEVCALSNCHSFIHRYPSTKTKRWNESRSALL
ncbi:hypothetical protein ILUMI_01156 [Ignelater luminosus]|uniref:PiggyBac transposable element-derived protein domain-containing protein n=1 Tax=Ignelater luminosus TaxID=2038154 RepID=A0A8K0DFV5_IGNLU|nr:hypothetical protein ILUMI_01156 [Ignelater luminosus]